MTRMASPEASAGSSRVGRFEAFAIEVAADRERREEPRAEERDRRRRRHVVLVDQREIDVRPVPEGHRAREPSRHRADRDERPEDDPAERDRLALAAEDVADRAQARRSRDVERRHALEQHRAARRPLAAGVQVARGEERRHRPSRGAAAACRRARRVRDRRRGAHRGRAPPSRRATPSGKSGPGRLMVFTRPSA